MLTLRRPTQTNHPLFAFGGSTSSVLTGNWTSTTCSLASRLVPITPSERWTSISAILTDYLRCPAFALCLSLFMDLCFYGSQKYDDY